MGIPGSFYWIFRWSAYCHLGYFVQTLCCWSKNVIHWQVGWGSWVNFQEVTSSERDFAFSVPLKWNYFIKVKFNLFYPQEHFAIMCKYGTLSLQSYFFQWPPSSLQCCDTQQSYLLHIHLYQIFSWVQCLRPSWLGVQHRITPRLYTELRMFCALCIQRMLGRCWGAWVNIVVNW